MAPGAKCTLDIFFEDLLTFGSCSAEERITLSKAYYISDAFAKHGYDFFAGLNIVETMRDLGLEQYLPQPVPLAPPPQALEARTRLPIVSIVYTTKHPGSYDMLLTSLSLQSSIAYELICIDESAALRIEEIKQRARVMGVRLAAVLPGKPVEASKRRRYKLFSAYNTGLLASSGAIITMLNDYSFLSRDFVRDTLAFYLKHEDADSDHSGSLTWTSRSKSLLGYADTFYSAPAYALNSSALVDHSALTVLMFDGLFGVNPAATGWQVLEEHPYIPPYFSLFVCFFLVFNSSRRWWRAFHRLRARKLATGGIGDGMVRHLRPPLQRLKCNSHTSCCEYRCCDECSLVSLPDIERIRRGIG